MEARSIMLQWSMPYINTTRHTRTALIRTASRRTRLSDSKCSMTLTIPVPPFDPPLILFERVSQQVGRHITATVSNPISILGISSPLFCNPQQQKCLRSLLTKAGLHESPSYHQTSSALATAAANRIGMCACPYSFMMSECDDTASMVLSVDYSEVALTILTYGNFYEWHNGGIVFAMATTSDRDDINGMFWHSTRKALESMLAETPNKRIDRIVRSGTMASDSNLHRAILSSLGSGYGVTMGAALEQSPLQLEALELPVVNPEIAAAQGVAYLAWQSTMRGCLDPCTWRRRLGLPLFLWDF